MSEHQVDPQEEKEALYAAICALHERWGQSGMAHAFMVLCAAVEEAEQALSEFEAQQARGDLAFQVHVLGLQTLVMCAREEIARAERYALETIGQRLAREGALDKALDTTFLPGAILSCPGCGEGLYKVTTRATTEELMLDDGTILVPLNRTVPSRDVWKPLACPFCGGRLFKDGQIHTLQRGWK